MVILNIIIAMIIIFLIIEKGCERGSRGTKNQLVIDKTVLKDCKKRHTNLPMAWIDCRKAYDLVPHSWVNECIEMFEIAENLRTF